MRTINKIITKCDCRYGAPMGRDNVYEGIYLDFPFISPDDQRKLPKLYDCEIKLTDGYDKGGAYWGTGKQLRVSYTKDLQLIHFYRQ